MAKLSMREILQSVQRFERKAVGGLSIAFIHTFQLRIKSIRNVSVLRIIMSLLSAVKNILTG